MIVHTQDKTKPIRLETSFILPRLLATESTNTSKSAN